MSTVERVTVSFEVTRSRRYQAVKFGVSEEIALGEGDDREAVVRSARARLFKEAGDTAAKALEHVLAQEEAAGGPPGL